MPINVFRVLRQWRIVHYLHVALEALVDTVSHAIQPASSIDQLGTALVNSLGKFVKFDRLNIAAQSSTPLALVHGTEDAVSPIEDARTIAHRTNATLVEIDGAGHLDLWAEPHLERTRDAVLRLLQEPTPARGELSPETADR